MGGLSAAARLSAQGHEVTVLEQSERPGGKLETYRRDGFAFDTGPSLLTLPAVYRDLFLKTPVRRKGASLEENIDLQGLDTAFGYHWADGATATIPGSNSNRVAAALGAGLGGSAEAQWQRFSRRAADIWSVTRVPFLESPVGGVRDLKATDAQSQGREDRRAMADVARAVAAVLRRSAAGHPHRPVCDLHRFRSPSCPGGPCRHSLRRADVRCVAHRRRSGIAGRCALPTLPRPRHHVPVQRAGSQDPHRGRASVGRRARGRGITELRHRHLGRRRDQPCTDDCSSTGWRLAKSVASRG